MALDRTSSPLRGFPSYRSLKADARRRKNPLEVLFTLSPNQRNQTQRDGDIYTTDRVEQPQIAQLQHCNASQPTRSSPGGEGMC